MVYTSRESKLGHWLIGPSSLIKGYLLKYYAFKTDMFLIFYLKINK